MQLRAQGERKHTYECRDLYVCTCVIRCVNAPTENYNFDARKLGKKTSAYAHKKAVKCDFFFSGMSRQQGDDLEFERKHDAWYTTLCEHI